MYSKKDTTYYYFLLATQRLFHLFVITRWAHHGAVCARCDTYVIFWSCACIISRFALRKWRNYFLIQKSLRNSNSVAADKIKAHFLTLNYSRNSSQHLPAQSVSQAQKTLSHIYINAHSLKLDRNKIISLLRVWVSDWVQYHRISLNSKEDAVWHIHD